MPDLEASELILRVLAAGALGALIGLERELSDQPAGLRTHILVALGAALFTLTGAFGLGGALGRGVDPTRVAAQVVTGIGFLGAGAILRQGLTVRGLTTAAGLWVTAAVGTAVAFGFWEGAFFTTIVTVVALFALKWVERRSLRKLKPGRFEFVLDARPDLQFSAIAETLEAHRCKIDSVRLDTSDEGHRHVVLLLRLPPRVGAHEFAGVLQGIEGVDSVDWSR